MGPSHCAGEAGPYDDCDRRRAQRGDRGGARLATLAMGLCAAVSTAAVEGDPLSLSAAIAETHDDNLLRGPSSGPVISDSVSSRRIGATLRLLDGRQLLDASASLLDARYRRLGSQDYRAADYALRAGSDIGRAWHVEARLQQTQSPAPQGNYRFLLRDLVTDRSVAASASCALTPLDVLEARVSRLQSGNDNAIVRFNDVTVNARSLGFSHAFGEGSRLGLRASTSRGLYADPQAGITLSGQPYDASYHERRLALVGVASVTPISTASATLEGYSRSYDRLAATGMRGTLGSLLVETDPGGRLKGGLGIRRELGGLGIPTSSQVLTDSLEMHASESLSAVTLAKVQLEFDRRRYGTDAPGLPAHSEFETSLMLALRLSPWRFLSFELAATGDWRHARPENFSYTDRRYTLTAVIAP